MQAFYQFSKASIPLDIKHIFIELISFVALFMMILIIHEANHGIFFKLFDPNPRIKFGYQTGMVYTSSPGSRYKRNQYIVIALMPCLIISLVLIALFPIVVPHSSLFDILTAAHLSTCIGDFYLINQLLKAPKDVKNRKEFGHWELDTVVSSRVKSKGCFASFAERKSRIYIALPMPNRSKVAMQTAIEDLRENLPKEALKSFTSDRGKEFACYPEVEAAGIDFYFADAYRAWQRGTNENSNGLLREFFP